jgi:uncharacterized Ntn-hydrolase superfamily protein
VDRIITACTRPTLAEGALYSYARGGSEITGPSIRLAEAIAQEWGNLQFGVRELDQRRKSDGTSETVMESFAYDIERNTRQVKVFSVPHVRFTKGGAKKLEDPRDVYEMTANQAARRLRSCILGIIPGDVIEAAVRQCEATMTNSAQVTADSIAAMVKAFEGYNVSRAMIEKRIQRRVDSITPGIMVQLRKIYASLKDGMGSVSDFFEIVQESAPVENAATATERLKNKIKPASKSVEVPAVDCSGEPSQEELDAMAEREAIEGEAAPQ